MNKKELVREYVKKNRYFDLAGVIKETGLSNQAAKNYLHIFKGEGIIFSAGGGIYSSVPKEFSCPENSRVARIRQIIKKNSHFLILLSGIPYVFKDTITICRRIILLL